MKNIGLLLFFICFSTIVNAQCLPQKYKKSLRKKTIEAVCSFKEEKIYLEKHPTVLCFIYGRKALESKDKFAQNARGFTYLCMSKDTLGKIPCKKELNKKDKLGAEKLKNEIFDGSKEREFINKHPSVLCRLMEAYQRNVKPQNLKDYLYMCMNYADFEEQTKDVEIGTPQMIIQSFETILKKYGGNLEYDANAILTDKMLSIYSVQVLEILLLDSNSF